MQILYTSTLYPPSIGGAQTHIHRLAKEIQSHGNQIYVAILTSRYRRDWLRLATVFPEKACYYKFDGVPISQIGYPFLVRLKMAPCALVYYFFMAKTVKLISKVLEPYINAIPFEPSIIHATRIGREFLTRAALNLARKKDIPFVLTANHHPRWKGYLYREYNKIYRDADAIIALTDDEKETLVEECGVNHERVHVTGIGPMLTEGFSINKFRKQYNLNGKYILYLGQQIKYKGINTIIKAAHDVWKVHPDIKFVFVGPPSGYSNKIFKKVSDERVINFGQLNSEMKTSAIAACEFLCLPSSQESFGGVFVEAWSFGKAVIGGRIGSISCVIEDGVDGLLSGQDPGELASKIIYLLNNPKDSRKMGAIGQKKVDDNYTWAKIAKKTLDIYRAIC